MIVVETYVCIVFDFILWLRGHGLLKVKRRYERDLANYLMLYINLTTMTIYYVCLIN